MMTRFSSSVGLGLMLAATRSAPTTAQQCATDSKGNCKPINIVCDALEDYQIHWDCVFGPESLEEVFQRGGDFTTCPDATKAHPCSRFIVDKDEERSEVKVQEGPEGFPFLYGEEYIFKYSFKAIEDMQVATRFTHLGQLKGSAGGYMIKGDPIYSLTANKHGLHVRFSNLESIEDYHDGLDMPLDWDAATGEWVHVEIITTFGKSMVVNISGAVSGKAVWPSDLKPVAWHRDSEMVRMKLGLYHSIHNVHDQEVIYQDISIEGPNGIIRTSPTGPISPTPTPIVDTCLALGSCPVGPSTTCSPLSGSKIDWNCMFGSGSLVEVEARGGKLISCSSGTDAEPCSRFIVPKESERAEVLAQKGVNGFQFAKGETYIFKYSFRAKDGMKVSGSSTRMGQMKGVSGGFQLKGNPLFSVTANNNGITVRFNNEDDDNVEGMEDALSWEDATGEWVNVEIRTTFGKSMEVYFSGAVEGKAVWPSSYKPVAWNSDADTIMFKLGLYHIKNKVADAEVEYKNISIQGPNGLLRTSSVGDVDHGPPQGIMSLGCVKDVGNDRLLDNIFRFGDLTPEKCSDYCEAEPFFGMQYGSECWCGTGAGEDVEDMFRHGSATCNMPCSGDKDKRCGGSWAMSLYQHGSASPADIPEGTRYLGCFKDNRFNRVLSKKQTSSNDMTLEWCEDYCANAKAKYFGVQWGKECFCGDADDDYTQYGTGTCDMPCSGDPRHICGSNSALSTFMRY